VASRIPPLVERERPGLSDTLPHRALGLRGCWSCGQLAALDDLQRWIESDPWDRRDVGTLSPIIVLCAACSKRHIEPHPRLYAPLGPREPRPGAVPLCVGCLHHDGVRCASPRARVNGGPGLRLIGRKPTVMHICRSPRSRSGWFTDYHSWPHTCDGREPTTPEDSNA
jgi:hypothetical protein